MKKFLLVLLFPLSVFAEDLSKVKELYMPTGHGYVALTVEDCKEEERVKATFPYKAYAVDWTKTEIEEGCWGSPSMEGAPKNAFPLVNIWAYGEILNFRQADFTPKKPSNEIKGDI